VVCCRLTKPKVGDVGKIAAWLRADASEKRGFDTVAFQDSVMPILRDLADRIERREFE
jgi:hypothetical protein